MASLRNLEILTFSSPKTRKGENLGYLTLIQYQSPASTSGTNVCKHSTEGCRFACLHTAGRGGIFKEGETSNAISRARLRRTLSWVSDPIGHIELLANDIEIGKIVAKRNGQQLAVRLNGTSDIDWGDVSDVLERFADVQFYDYTKAPYAARRRTIERHPAYHLTYSRSERLNSDQQAIEYLREGVNTATVFDTVPVGQRFNLAGVDTEVIDGDLNDLRFLDPPNVMVGLKAKGKAKRDTTGFVVRLNG
jgi:hypothetical protein